MRDERARRSGTILFEVVIGLTIIAIAGIGWVTLVAQTRTSIASVRQTANRTMAASDLLKRYTTYSQTELDSRMGTARDRTFDVSIESREPHLYAIAVVEPGTGHVVLRTTLYARDTTNAR